MEQDEQRRPVQPGTVTRLAGQQKNPQRVSVFIDEAFAFGVHGDLVVEFGLYKGQALSVEEQQRIVEADRERAARVVALDYLGYRARTEHEVRQKLARSGFDEAVAERTVARLRERGYLDDEAYARSYVQARFRNRGYGPGRLRSDLHRRGVARGLIDAVLEALVDQEDMLEAARRHAEKRWPRLAAEADAFKRRKKLSEYLVRRGFSYDTARRVVEEFENQRDR
ncbi:MAG: RecX family transcriptional regulator [Bacteroidetes bacterium]|nr:RecX family transcriptional regulator [Bacteroidota bacterium]